MIFICESSKKQTKRRNNMSSSNKTSLGLNAWSPSDKPVRQDFVDDNIKIDEQITKLNRDLINTNTTLTNTTNALNGRVSSRIAFRWDDGGALQLYVDGTYFGSIKFIDK